MYFSAGAGASEWNGLRTDDIKKRDTITINKNVINYYKNHQNPLKPDITVRYNSTQHTSRYINLY